MNGPVAFSAASSGALPFPANFDGDQSYIFSEPLSRIHGLTVGLLKCLTGDREPEHTHFRKDTKVIGRTLGFVLAVCMGAWAAEDANAKQGPRMYPCRLVNKTGEEIRVAIVGPQANVVEWQTLRAGDEKVVKLFEGTRGVIVWDRSWKIIRVATSIIFDSSVTIEIDRDKKGEYFVILGDFRPGKP